MAPDQSPLRVGIVGSGNIGTDLMLKIERTAGARAGRRRRHRSRVRRARPGRRARPLHDRRGAPRHARVGRGNRARLRRDLGPGPPGARAHAGRARRSGPSTSPRPRSGPAVIPAVNLEAHLAAPDVNLVTCGAQATVPIAAAIAAVDPGLLRRDRLDDLRRARPAPGPARTSTSSPQSTARALERVGGADRGKAIMLLNPADPPILMRNTVFADVARCRLRCGSPPRSRPGRRRGLRRTSRATG